MSLKKIVKYIVLLSLAAIGWYCSDNTTGINDSCMAPVYTKDSIYSEITDTAWSGYFEMPVLTSGVSTHNLRLVFEAETNCDSINGIPLLEIKLTMNKSVVYSYSTASKNDINRTFDLYFNKIYTSNQFYDYKLYLRASVMKGFIYGRKYIVLRHINLWCN